MTKYKWSLLGLIISAILFLIFFIGPLISFINNAIVPAEPVPEGIHNYSYWYENAPKIFNWRALREFGKSFYHWNLFWIPIIVFSFMAFNYKKSNKT